MQRSKPKSAPREKGFCSRKPKPNKRRGYDINKQQERVALGESTPQPPNKAFKFDIFFM